MMHALPGPARPRSLIVGPIVGVIALGLFSLIASLISNDNALTAFDKTVASRLHEEARQSPHTVPVFRGFTTLGNHEVVMLLVAGLGVALLIRGQYGLAVAVLLVASGGELLNLGTKHWFLRERPEFSDPIIHRPSSPSFPSGHAMGACINYGMLAYLLYQLGSARRWQRCLFGALVVVGLVFTIRYFVPSWHQGHQSQVPEVWEVIYGLGAYALLLTPLATWVRMALLGVLALLILAIGFSRIYLGAHWFSDVAGGFLAGTAWLAACLVVLEGFRLWAAQWQATPNAEQNKGLPTGTGVA